MIGAQQMAFDFVPESAMKELREYSRVRKDVKACFEFVKWNEWDPDEIKKPITIRSYDISASGVSSPFFKIIAQYVEKQLGEKS